MSAKGKRMFADLFCGIGGIRQGMERYGFECVFSCDKDAACRKVYEQNYGETPYGDVYEIQADTLPDFDVLCAGFPCQPFSISGRMRGFEDTRGTLFFEICRIIDAKKPQAVLLENVKHLIHHDHGKTLETILDSLMLLGYSVSWRVLNAMDFGVPQNRERIIIVALRNGQTFSFDGLRTNHCNSMLPFLDHGKEFVYLEPSAYTLIAEPHINPNSGLMFVGYRNKAIRKAGVRPGTEHLSRVHKQPNRIYSVRGVHPTLPAQELSGRFFILGEDGRVRKLTIDECYRFMGFPETFERASSLTEQYRQIGNSVCIPMISAVAEKLRDYIE